MEHLELLKEVWKVRKSARVSKTLLNILANFNNDVVCIVSILPLISNSSRLFPYL